MFLKKMQTHFDSYHAILIKKKIWQKKSTITVKPILLTLNGKRFKNFFNLRNI